MLAVYNQGGTGNIYTNKRYILLPVAFNKIFSAYVQHYGISAQSNGIQARKDRIEIVSSLNDTETLSYLAFGL